jgi:hypothetical protein
MARKKEGIELLRPKQDPVPIEQITLLDWYAAFGANCISVIHDDPEMNAKAVFEFADACLRERALRV